MSVAIASRVGESVGQDAGGPSSARRTWVVLGVLAVVLVVLVAVTGPAGTEAAGPGGTLAFQRFLSAMGLHVTNADAPPSGPGVFLLLADLRDEDQMKSLLAWVQDGGTLVVADPGSVALDLDSISVGGSVGSYTLGRIALSPQCAAPEASGITTIDADAEDQVLTTSEAGAVACFPTPRGAFEVALPSGKGRLVVLGGISPFTNALFGQAGNARFALNLFSVPANGGGTEPVVFGSPAPSGAPANGGAWSSLPVAARVVIVELLAALGAFAFARGRRLGMPLAEHLPAELPSSELVGAVGRLYRSSRAAAWAGDTMRRRILGQLAGRLGMRRSMDPAAGEALAQALAGTSGVSPEEVRRLVLGPPPATDDALIAWARDLERLRAAVQGQGKER